MERDWVSACMDNWICQLQGGEAATGKGRTTWKEWQECIADDTRQMNLRKEDFRSQRLWRSCVLRNRQTRASVVTNVRTFKW